MRALALAGIVVLAGCSLPYKDTIFTATPKFKHEAEGGHEQKNDRGPGESAPGAETATDMARGEYSAAGTHRDQPLPEGAVNDEGLSAKSRVGAVFPPTAQPAGSEDTQAKVGAAATAVANGAPLATP